MRQYDFGASLVTPLARPWDLEERDLLLVETLLDAVLLVLILYLILACMILAAKRADVAEGQSEFAHELGELQVLHCPLSTEVTEADVRAAVDDPFAWGQLLRFGWFVLRPLGNLALLIYTAATLARWQPHKPWDLERHIVICGKGLAAMVSLSLLLAFVLKSAVLSLSKFPDTLLATTAVCRLASSLSSLRLLTLADPVATWTWTKQVLMKNPGMIKLQGNAIACSLLVLGLMGSWKAFSARVMIYMFACTLIPTLLCFALMALLIKISDFSFITQGDKWAPPDFVRVLLFVSALAGLEMSNCRGGTQH